MINRSWQRAEELLLAHLTPAQRGQYEHSMGFDVVGGHTGRRYRITTGATYEIDAGREVAYLCLVPRKGKYLPAPDTMLARKIAFELYEAKARRLAVIAPQVSDYRGRGLLDASWPQRLFVLGLGVLSVSFYYGMIHVLMAIFTELGL